MSGNMAGSDKATGLLARLGERLFGESAGALRKKAWPEGIKEDLWLYTGCRSCTQPRCGMKVHRVNGIITEVEGDPDHPMTAGTLCVRGQGNVGNLYNPYRVKAPMKRTNPEKGADVDPGWMEISWEEAMDTIVEKLSEVLESDPRQFIVMAGFGSFGDDLPVYREAFPKAFGTPNIIENNGNLCAVHYGTLTFHGEFVENIDMERCNYLISCGHSPGARFVSAAGETRASEDAKERGMKMVLIDPHYCSDAQGGEWLPIRPGTDLAFQLAFIHVMLHELNRYDEWFVKNRTDCPYLIMSEGGYARDSETSKPIMWSLTRNEAVTFDDPDYGDLALEGEYEVKGVKLKPVFQVIKDNVREYTPEWAEEITSVPAAIIRRIAEEFVEAAQIGSTIDIEGFTFPYRPALFKVLRGSVNHSSGAYVMMAANIINGLVGATDGPGNSVCQTVGPMLEPNEDGVVHCQFKNTPHAEEYVPNEWTWPPNCLDMAQFYPHRHCTPQVAWRAIVDPKKYYLDYEPKVMMCQGGNPFFNNVAYDEIEAAFRKIPFIFSVAYSFDEVTQYCDILLPEHSSMERLGFDKLHKVTRATDDFRRRVQGFNCRLSILEQPLFNTRDLQDVCMELINRLGLKEKAYRQISGMLKMMGTGWELDPAEDYTWGDVFDRYLKAHHGDKDRKYFIEHGVCQDWTLLPLRETYGYYYFPDNKTRHPMYDNHLRSSGERVMKLCAEHKCQAPGWDMEEWAKHFEPLPHWFLTNDFKAAEEYDLFAVNWKTPSRAFGTGGVDDNALLRDMDSWDPEVGYLMLNSATAEKRGLKDGDEVLCESPDGSLKGVIKTTELLHPDCVGFAANFGHRAPLMAPFSRNGLNYNVLLTGADGCFDPVSGGVNISPQVKLTKIRAHGDS